MTKCFTDSSVPLLNELVLISIYRGIESTIYNDGNLIQYITVIGRSGASAAAVVLPLSVVDAAGVSEP